ncbi:MAG: protein phosphatase 2C domain-containing protein [Myxococcota bacterium]
MRSATLLGRHHPHVGHLASVAEAEAAITLSRGGAEKTYSHTEVNEDAAVFALGEGGSLIAVADGHFGASGSEAIVEFLLSTHAPEWTGPGALGHDSDSWQNTALDTLHACGRAVLSRAGELGLPPAPSTLSLALVRPAEDTLAWLCAGDSHVFVVEDTGAHEVGWHSLGRERSYFLGYEATTREGLHDRSLSGISPLSGVGAVVLATDGLSEPDIGVADPAAAAAAATERALDVEPQLRPLTAARGLAEIALEAQRGNRAGDNIATAVFWNAPV